MNDKQPQNEEAKQWREELRQDDNTRQHPDPFEQVKQKLAEDGAPEEAEAEQQYKEALTERD